MSTKLAPNAKCLVCNDEASGFHYGVYSCEGCKGFFRRCITQGINFRCSNEEKCQITPFTRNSCQYCRLKKCFQVGMSREASRLGRRPKKILRGTKSSDTDLKCNSDSGDPTGSPEMLDNPMLARATMADMFGFSPDMMQQMSEAMPMMMKNMRFMSQPPPGMGVGINVGNSNMDNAMRQNSQQQSPFSPTGMPPGMMSPGMMPPGMAPPPSMQGMSSPDGSSALDNNGEVSVTDLNKWREKQLEVMSRYMHTNKETADSSSEMIPKTEPVNKENSPADLRSLEPQTPMSSDSGFVSSSSSATTDAINISHVSNTQKQKLHRFMGYGEMELSEETMDIIVEVQEGIITSHMQHCLHLRPHIEQAEQDIKRREAAGENVKPPGGFWSHWMSELLPTIERVVRFLKDVPGFRELTIADQILSIKKGAFSIVLSQAMTMVNEENFTIIDPTLKYKNSRDDFETMPTMFRKLFDDHFLLSSEFKRARITDVETALLNAILGVNSGVEGYENETAIIKLEQIFVQALYLHIINNYPDDSGRFERMIKLIPLVENTNQSHSTSLHSMKTDSPMAPTAFPSLHREIYDM